MTASSARLSAEHSDASEAISRFEQAGPIDIRSVALSGIFLLLLFYTLYFAAPVLMPIAVAVLFNLLLAPAVRLLARLRIPQPLGAALVLALGLGLFAGAVSLLADPAREWMQKAPDSFYQVETKLRSLKEPIEKIQQASSQIEQATQLGDKQPTQKVEIERPGLTQALLAGTPEVLASTGIVIVLLYFLLASGDSIRRKVVSVIPLLQDKKRAVEIMRGIERDISYYLLTVTFINLVLGIIVTLVLTALGVPNPLLWGAMIALFNYAPYIGAAAGIVILAAVGLLSFDTLPQALLVPGFFLVLTVLEGQLITPMILGRRLLLSPVAIFITMVIWGWLWGVTGALIAVPLLASIKIICENFEPLQPVAEFLSP